MREFVRLKPGGWDFGVMAALLIAFVGWPTSKLFRPPFIVNQLVRTESNIEQGKCSLWHYCVPDFRGPCKL